MWYVYIIKSTISKYKYIGSTNNIYKRIAEHNNGQCKSSSPYKPFKLIAYIAVDSKDKAIKLERYLKSGSGSSFIRKHLL